MSYAISQFCDFINTSLSFFPQEEEKEEKEEKEEIIYLLNYKIKQNKKNFKLIDYYVFFPDIPVICQPTRMKKFESVSNSSNTSMNQRISQIIQSTRLGGKLQYAGNPVPLNYLGRAEGMPGGSGAPPRNR